MTSYGPDVSERLAHTFATWQMYYFGHELEVVHQHSQGRADQKDIVASQRGTLLADTILNNSVTSLAIEEWQPNQKFRSASGDTPNFAKQLDVYRSFPYELFQWNRQSRRVFHLPHSLEAMLAAAEFPDMKWNDVLWPFDSFIITVEKPIVVRHPIDLVDQPFDTVMVTRTAKSDGTAVVRFRWLHLPPTSGKRLGFTLSEMREFRSLLKKKPQAAARFWNRKYKEIYKFSPFQLGSQHAELDIGEGRFEDIIVEPEELHVKLGGMKDSYGNRYYDESTRSFFEGLSVTIRIVVGWMLYLETLSNDSMQWRTPSVRAQRMIAGGAPAIITEPDHICDIVGKGRIHPSEVTSEPNRRCSKGFVRPHWRRAHYKRPRGSTPDAPKSVRIPPVLVRADLVPLYGIIGGTRTVVIPEE